MKKTIITLLSAICLQSTFAQDILTLEKAIELTLEKNYDIKISKNNEEIAKNNKAVLNSGYLPNVTLNAGGNYGIRDNAVTLTDGRVFEIDEINSVGYNASINLNYVLFNGLGRVYNLKKFKEQHHLSELQTKFVIENTLYQVYAQYYIVAQQYQTIKNLKETLKTSSNRLKRATYGFDYGQNSKLEILNAEVDYNNDSINLLNTQVQLDNAKKNLNQLMGVAIDYDFIAETNITFSSNLNLDALQTKAVENNTLLNQAEKNILLNEFDIKIARSKWLPQLNLAGSYNFNNTNNDANSGFNSPLAANFNNIHGPSAQINLTWSLFDGGKTATNIQNAKINVQNRTAELELQKQKIARDVSVAWYKYKNALEIINIQTSNLETNKSNFLRTEEKYKSGQINSINFRQAQLNLLNAENQLNIAKFNAKSIEMNLLFLSGAIL